MQQASVCLLGEHDFASYRAVECQAKSPMRNIMRLEIHRQEELVFMEIEANAFLHHMVRNIAGVLMMIGSGRAPIEWSQQVLEAHDRAAGGITAPPDGLYLSQVAYPHIYNLPDPAGMHWPFIK
jgi:Pseudouridylate synthase